MIKKGCLYSVAVRGGDGSGGGKSSVSIVDTIIIKNVNTFHVRTDLDNGNCIFRVLGMKKISDEIEIVKHIDSLIKYFFERYTIKLSTVVQCVLDTYDGTGYLATLSTVDESDTAKCKFYGLIK